MYIRPRCRVFRRGKSAAIFILLTMLTLVREAPETPIFQAIECLSEKKVSGLPVTDTNNTLVGIISEWDVLELLTTTNIGQEATVEQYMTKQVISFTEDDSVLDICEFFQEKKARRAPIVRDGKLVGIVSRHDIIKLIITIRKKIKKD